MYTVEEFEGLIIRHCRWFLLARFRVRRDLKGPGRKLSWGGLVIAEVGMGRLVRAGHVVWPCGLQGRRRGGGCGCWAGVVGVRALVVRVSDDGGVVRRRGGCGVRVNTTKGC